MQPSETFEECVDRLLRGFRTYDRGVDVVSSFEMVFRESKSDVPDTVAHFERYPSIREKERNLTPEFTVLFIDNHALTGEIARIAQPDESVDALCSQLAAYDAIAEVPDASGGTSTVSGIDVVLLVPLDVGPSAAIRILDERLGNREHPYKPSHAPCIVQFGFDEGRYLFQRIPHALNGMPRDLARADGLGNWFATNGDFRAAPQRIAHIKSASPFINDTADDLYLAVHLWARTFANRAGEIGAVDRPVEIVLGVHDIGTELRRTYAPVRNGDIRRALDLLERAKMAESAGGNSWRIAWEEPRGGDGDLARILAERVCRPPGTGPLTRLRRRAAVRGANREDQTRLF